MQQKWNMKMTQNYISNNTEIQWSQDIKVVYFLDFPNVLKKKSLLLEVILPQSDRWSND